MPNDGSQSSQKATVTNRLNKPIIRSLPFYMQQGKYTPSAGEVTETQLYGTKQYVEVKVTISANANKTIELKR
jgi:hypothetical protein